MTDEQRKHELKALFTHLREAQDFDTLGLRIAVLRVLAKWEALLAEWEVKE